MPFDSEELERRRQQRLERQQRRQQEQRKLIVRLVAAAIVLVLAAVIILVVSVSSSGGSEETTAASRTETVEQTQQSTQATQPPTTVIHLAAAGDLNITDAVVAAGGAEYDYTDAFLDVAHILADADIAAVNLEGNLYGAPYGTETASAPQSMMDALASAGVDLVQLANSYAINQGLSGLGDTIRGVRAAGMEPLGVYADPSEFKTGKGFTIREIQGVKIAFVAFTKGMDGTALPAGNENCVNVLYTDYDSTYQEVDTEGITRILDAVNKAQPDLTVAFLHWGSEFNNTISDSQEKIRALLQENGVDAIIGTHSHYVQQMKLDAETGNFVAYSLGDFFGDAQRSGSEYSVILDLEITKDNESGQTAITNYSYTPIFTVAQKDAPLRILRIQEAVAAYEAGFIERVSQGTYEAMQYALGRIEARVTGE